MKKYKIIFFALVLSFMLVACDTNTETKERETVVETSVELNTVGETSEETSTENTTLEENKETDSETKNESIDKSNNKTNSTQIVEIVEDQKDSDNNVVEIVNIAKSSAPELNNNLTNELQEQLKNLSVTLITINGVTYDQFPEENLQAIAKYKDSESYGWIVRYGENKIGLAQIYNSSTTGVLVMFDGRSVLESDVDVITNDSVQEFKSQAEKIIQKEISGDAEISYGY